MIHTLFKFGKRASQGVRLTSSSECLAVACSSWIDPRRLRLSPESILYLCCRKDDAKKLASPPFSLSTLLKPFEPDQSPPRCEGAGQVSNVESSSCLVVETSRKQKGCEKPRSWGSWSTGRPFASLGIGATIKLRKWDLHLCLCWGLILSLSWSKDLALEKPYSLPLGFPGLLYLSLKSGCLK